MRTTKTSKQAAVAIAPHAANLRERVYRYIKSRSTGSTREELELATGLDGNTCRPRVWELLKAKRIYVTATTRKTTSGRNAEVLKA